MKKLIVLTILSLLPLAAQAAPKADFTIKGLGISHSSGSIFINVNEVIESTSCEDKKKLRIPNDSPVFKEMWSMLLTAQAIGQSINVSYREADCLSGSSIINYLYLRS